MTDIVEWTRTCRECKKDEHIVDETTNWTTEQWFNFQRNLYAPWVCRQCLETSIFSWK